MKIDWTIVAQFVLALVIMKVLDKLFLTAVLEKIPSFYEAYEEVA